MRGVMRALPAIAILTSVLLLLGTASAGRPPAPSHPPSPWETLARTPVTATENGIYEVTDGVNYSQIHGWWNYSSTGGDTGVANIAKCGTGTSDWSGRWYPSNATFTLNSTNLCTYAWNLTYILWGWANTTYPNGAGGTTLFPGVDGATLFTIRYLDFIGQLSTAFLSQTTTASNGIKLYDLWTRQVDLSPVPVLVSAHVFGAPANTGGNPNATTATLANFVPSPTFDNQNYTILDGTANGTESVQNYSSAAYPTCGPASVCNLTWTLGTDFHGAPFDGTWWWTSGDLWFTDGAGLSPPNNGGGGLGVAPGESDWPTDLLEVALPTVAAIVLIEIFLGPTSKRSKRMR